MTSPLASHEPTAPDETSGGPVVDLAALYERLPMAVAVVDRRLVLARANARFRELFGEAARQPLRTLLACERIGAAAAEVVADGEARRIDGSVSPTGARFDVSLLPVAVGGEPGCALVVADVTERERLRETAERTATELAAIIDVVPEALVVCDAERRIVRFNALGRVRYELPEGGATLADIFARYRPLGEDGQPLAFERIPSMRALAGETVIAEKLYARSALNDPPVFEVSAAPLRSPDGRIVGAVSLARDITERERMAQQLAEQVRIGQTLLDRVTSEAERLEALVQERTEQLAALQAARAREQRLAAVGELAAGVMHDVNNALNPIMAAAYLVARHAEEPAAVREYASRIAHAADTGAALTARLARFIRQEPIDASREDAVDVGALCLETARLVEHTWRDRPPERAITLECRTAPALHVRGIPGELRAALINLIGNAVDAMPNGGTLTIDAHAAAGEVVLEVADTGCGMPPHVLERAFEPFFTTKGRGGTGLGLSEVYGVVRRHRGRAEIDSIPDIGTRVRLVFPQAPAPAVGSGCCDDPAAPRRVLVLESDPDMREFVVGVLAASRHIVHAAESLDDALGRLGSAAPPFDVVVAAVEPGGDAARALGGAARDRCATARVIAVAPWSADRADDEGGVVLRKPMRASELLSAVEDRG